MWQKTLFKLIKLLVVTALLSAGMPTTYAADPTYGNTSFWKHSVDLTEANKKNPNADHCGRQNVWRYEWDNAGETDLSFATVRQLMNWNAEHGWWAYATTSAIISWNMAHPEKGYGTDLTWVAPDVLGTGREIRITGMFNRREAGGKGTNVAIYKLAGGTVEKLWAFHLAPQQRMACDLKTMVKQNDQIIFRFTPVDNDVVCASVEMDPTIGIVSETTK